MSEDSSARCGSLSLVFFSDQGIRLGRKLKASPGSRCWRGAVRAPPSGATLPAPPHPPPSAPETTNPLSVSMNLPILDISHQWDLETCVLLCLAPFTEHNVLEARPSVSGLRSFLWLANIPNDFPLRVDLGALFCTVCRLLSRAGRWLSGVGVWPPRHESLLWSCFGSPSFTFSSLLHPVWFRGRVSA